MSLPKFIFTNSNKLSTIGIVDGQFIVVKDTEKIYVDMGTERIDINNSFSGISVANGVITMTRNDGTTATATINTATTSANGLMSSTDKTKLNLTTPKSFSLATSAWSAVTASSNGGYSYRASIADSSVKSTDSADVRFDLSIIAVCLTAQVSPSVKTANGYIYLYSKTKPASTVTGVYLIQR